MNRALLLMLTGVVAVFGQPRSQISGFVRDSSTAVVTEAAVSILNLDTGIRRSTQTNGEGFYAISSLTPGQYRITVRKPGFSTVARTGIPLHALDSSRLDFTLNPGSIRDEITVPGTPPLLNTSDASYGLQTTRRPAEHLPLNGRGLQGLIDLTPGVLTTPATAGEAGQFSANGQRPATNYFTVDGVSANNGVSGSGLPGQFSGGALPAMTAIGSLHNLVALGELDELRVQTSTFAPEYGRLPGAQVAVSTRSGSNEFHGEIFGHIRHERLAARDWFANAAGLERVSQRMTDAGGTLGGPIRRNRTFFVLSTEQIRLRQPGTFLMAVPSLAARESAPLPVQNIVRAFPLPTGVDIGGGVALHTARTVSPSDVSTTSLRLDQSLADLGSVFFRLNRTPSSTRTGYLQQNEASFSAQTFTAGLVTALSPRLTNDARVGTSRTSVTSRWFPGAANLDLPSNLPWPGSGQKLYAVGIRGFSQLLAGDPGESRQVQWTLATTTSFTTGRRELRFGIDYQRLTPEREQAIESVVSVYQNYAELLAGRPPVYTFAQTAGGRSLLETFSLFAQDTWHATSRLNITYGVRWEFTPPPSYTLLQSAPPSAGSGVVPPDVSVNNVTVSSPPFWKTRYTQFAPRAGAAWRVSDRFVLRAGAGLFYDLGFSSAIDLINGAPYNRWRALTGIAAVPPDQVEYGFAPNLRLPFTTQWNVTAERALNADSAVSVAYVGSAGNRLLRREGALGFNQSLPAKVLATNNGTSGYHSLQLSYRSRSVRGVQGTASWTWAHAIDNGSWDSAAYLLFPGRDGNQDRSSSNFDVRHSFQAALAYDLGQTKLPWLKRWLISGAVRMRTGFPIDIVTTDQPFGLGFDNDLRPDLVPGVPVWLSDSTAPGGRRLNPAAFRTPAEGQGTLGRNAVSGNGIAQTDLAVEREFGIGERVRLQFRAESYNVMNSTSFADPVRVLSSPLFGTSPSLMNLMLGSGRPNSGLSSAFQSGGPRVLQLGVTIRF